MILPTTSSTKNTTQTQVGAMDDIQDIEMPRRNAPATAAGKLSYIARQF
jgi:hypothetical protein